MFRKFVLVTGALDFPIGLGVLARGLLDPQAESFTALIPLGAFLCFAGAALIWAAQDLKVRAPIVFWQGMVRFFSILGILYAVATGLEGREQIAVVVFDGIIAAVYVVGCIQLTGISPFQLMLGKTT